MLKDKILLALKNKYKNLGFSEKAISGVLTYLEKTVTEESQIDTAVDGVEDMLKAFQGEIDNRVSSAVNKAKGGQQQQQQGQGGEPDKGTEPAGPPADTPEWAKGFLTEIKSLKEEITTLKSGKTAETRKQTLQAALKDAPDAFKKTALKAFDRMKFDSDDEFNTYLEELKTDSAEFTQSQNNDNLGKAGKPIVPGGGDPSKPASKEEVDAVLKNIM